METRSAATRGSRKLKLQKAAAPAKTKCGGEKDTAETVIIVKGAAEVKDNVVEVPKVKVKNKGEAADTVVDVVKVAIIAELAEMGSKQEATAASVDISNVAKAEEKDKEVAVTAAGATKPRPSKLKLRKKASNSVTSNDNVKSIVTTTIVDSNAIQIDKKKMPPLLLPSIPKPIKVIKDDATVTTTIDSKAIQNDKKDDATVTTTVNSKAIQNDKKDDATITTTINSKAIESDKKDDATVTTTVIDSNAIQSDKKKM
jgi:hypothetical protein